VTRPRPRSRTSYTARRDQRQSLPYFRAVVVVGLALGGAGCSASTIDPIRTGSLIQTTVADSVDPSDWETVRRTIAEISSDALDHAWRNPKTGSTGTVTAMAPAPRGAELCRSFATTVSDYRGIRRYRGDACRNGGADWRITAVVPQDKQLL
jgi:surface antigen